MALTIQQQRFQHYLDLIEQPYQVAVAQLKKRHGPVKDDYFVQASYQQFLAGKVLRLQRGNYSRTRDGWCTHHVAENQFSNMSDAVTIKQNQYPFTYQRRDQLVYVDEVEHLILHALIAKETKGKFGYHGYREYLSKDVWDWYVAGHVPQKNWRHRCYGTALISKSQALLLFDRLNTGPLYGIVQSEVSTID